MAVNTFSGISPVAVASEVAVSPTPSTDQRKATSNEKGRGTTNPGLLICPPVDSHTVWRSLCEFNERMMAAGSYVMEDVDDPG